MILVCLIHIYIVLEEFGGLERIWEYVNFSEIHYPGPEEKPKILAFGDLVIWSIFNKRKVKGVDIGVLKEKKHCSCRNLCIGKIFWIRKFLSNSQTWGKSLIFMENNFWCCYCCSLPRKTLFWKKFVCWREFLITPISH